MDIPTLVADLRNAADALERIFGAAAPAAAAPMLALPAPSPIASLPGTAGGKPTKTAARKSPARPAKKGGQVLTDARKEILRRDWPRGVATPLLLDALNKLPGRKLRNNAQIASLAATLELHRPASGRQPRTPPSEDALPAASPVREVVATAPVVVAPVRNVVAPPPRPVRRPPSPLASRDGAPSVAARELAEARAAEAEAPVTWSVAMTWAERNRVQLGGTEEQDLAATNQARRDAKLPPYRIIDQRGRAERLPDPRVGGNVETVAA